MFWEDSEKSSSKKAPNLLEKMQNIDADTAKHIRFGLNVTTLILTAGIFHLAYYAFMFFNWFVGQCTGVRAVKNPEWDPFANIKYLNPDADQTPAYSF